MYSKINKNRINTNSVKKPDNNLVIQNHQTTYVSKKKKFRETIILCQNLNPKAYSKFKKKDSQLPFKHKFAIIKNKFIIFVPYCDVYYDYIIECLTSIEYQNYDNYEVIIVNDGGKKMDLINEFINNKKQYKILHSDINNGPGYSKWLFINYIQQNISKYNLNDICIIIDGDDTINNNTFNIINNTYNNHKCWVTYGNATGAFCDFNDCIVPSGNIRLQKWRYAHPRTLKLFLLNYLEQDDFKYNNNWLTKGTDRPIVYCGIELSGKKRVKFINKYLYNYREHENNSYKVVEPRYKLEQLNYLTNLTPFNEIIEDIHVIMCSWKRVCNLVNIIYNLNNQTVSKRIHFHILNNNINESNNITNIINSVKYNCDILISQENFDNKYNGFQRFLYIKDVLLKKYIIDYVIIIDDDQYFNNNWIENLYNIRKEKQYICWYGKIFNKKKLKYWQPICAVKGEFNNNNKMLHYGGTGGSIIDTNIFKSDSRLWKIPTDLPVSVYNIEDLWLSFIITYYYNWKICPSCLPTSEYTNKDTQNNALYKTLKNEKQYLLKYLQNKYNWLK
jgi:hypothetical protein